MPLEREFKYLIQLREPLYESKYLSESITQGYLLRGPVEVRIRQSYSESSLTIKADTGGVGQRWEMVIPLPAETAATLLAHIPSMDQVRKRRVRVDAHWCVDLYAGDLQGLVVAEWEALDGELFVEPPMPTWMAARLNITGILAFSNQWLAGKSLDDLRLLFARDLFIRSFLEGSDHA